MAAQFSPALTVVPPQRLGMTRHHTPHRSALELHHQRQRMQRQGDAVVGMESRERKHASDPGRRLLDDRQTRSICFLRSCFVLIARQRNSAGWV